MRNRNDKRQTSAYIRDRNSLLGPLITLLLSHFASLSSYSVILHSIHLVTESSAEQSRRWPSEVAEGYGSGVFSRKPVAEWSECGNGCKVLAAVLVLCHNAAASRSRVNCTCSSKQSAPRAVESRAARRPLSVAARCSRVRFIRYLSGSANLSDLPSLVTVHQSYNLAPMHRDPLGQEGCAGNHLTELRTKP